MSFWSTVLKFCSNKWVLAGVTYIGVFLTIYFSMHKKHKKMKFAVARNHSNYVIALWNAGNQTIYCEDISYLYAYGNVNCKCDVVHTTDPDIPLEYTIGEDVIPYDQESNTRFNRHVKKIDFSFDFLPARHGYIVHIDNSQKAEYLSASLLLKGRIRGEKKSSIVGDLNCIGLKAIAKIIIYSIIGISLFSGLILAILVLCGAISERNEKMLFDCLFTTLIFLFPFLLVCYMCYLKSMPFDIFRKYRKYVRKYRYQDITYKVNKISRTKYHYRK